MNSKTPFVGEALQIEFLCLSAVDLCWPTIAVFRVAVCLLGLPDCICSDAGAICFVLY